MKPLLNFACGSRIHSDWLNIDFSPVDKRVKKVNLLSQLPYADSSFEAAYSSHFIEHLHPERAHKVLQEIRRVLQPNGIVRIVVPDLQNMARAYLSALEALIGVDSSSANPHKHTNSYDCSGGGGEVKHRQQ